MIESNVVADFDEEISYFEQFKIAKRNEYNRPI